MDLDRGRESVSGLCGRHKVTEDIRLWLGGFPIVGALWTAVIADTGG